MKTKAVIFGATGMVGQGVLLECLENPEVESVLVIGRNACHIKHPKLVEIIHGNFMNYSSIEKKLKGYNACFFCMGVSAFGMKEPDYVRITYSFTLEAAKTLVSLNPGMIFCYVSGTGTDSSEKGRAMWARVKGRTENDLLKLPFQNVYLFRPGYIQPMKGIKSKTRVYRMLYNLFAPLYSLFKLIIPGYVTTTEKLGKAMIRCAREGYGETILENRDINHLAAQNID